jgi:hypothetical protein
MPIARAKMTAIRWQSFPKRIEDGQFKGFNERIYIIKPGEWLSMMPKVDDTVPPAQEFDISVTRKS